jgi:hypothetical protein
MGLDGSQHWFGLGKEDKNSFPCQESSLGHPAHGQSLY